VAFLSALALWGWIELAFLTGIITGPVNQPCPRAPEWERFIRAWGTVAYHEMLLAFTLIAMIFASYGAENKFGALDLCVLSPRGSAPS
jgi:putative photosynthetic complex assembly protein 2